jgi:hypothetical protein
MNRKSRHRACQCLEYTRLVAAFARASVEATLGPYTVFCREFELIKNARPHPGPLQQERERRRVILRSLPATVAVDAALRFISETARPPDAFRSATRGRTIHPLLGERAGVRASVSHTFLSLHRNIRSLALRRAVEAHEREQISIIPLRFESSGFVVPISLFA